MYEDGYGDEDAAADEVRSLLRSWLRDTVPAEADTDPDSPAAGTGLDVPEATAAQVTDAVTRLLGLSAAPSPSDELCLLARVLVVEEHPSSAGWTEDEQEAVTRWIAVLIGRRGDEGVEALLSELRRGR
ncbi:hypothetical protein [Streptomyces sp. NPDC051183]|uniref:hypothetical protein n=1 Tax=unclassified Streptomyces TaxID=2593676 RepID=UPI003446331C